MVHIKQMICIGFKSFRKKTIINFDKGFSAIVGANGSGKSNIIDAFVFVLGALSAKMLRAKNIKDLISNGGHGLGPSETASVELIFDNHDHAFGVDLDEIHILRKIDRKGNGIYKLNSKRSTRKEIVNMLDLAGIMPNSSNMIMQGELFRLINMNATERRELIEDIAGISSYNEKKLSAEDELMQVQTSLGQISLLLNEVYLQLEQLKKEKEDAEVYLKIVEQEKIRNNAFYQVKINDALKKKQDMSDETIVINKKIEDISQLEKEIQNNIILIEKKIEVLEVKIKDLQDDELLQMTYQMKELKDRITELKTSLKYDKQNLGNYEDEKKEVESHLKSLDEQEKTLKSEIKMVETSKEQLETKINDKSQEILKYENDLEGIDEQYIKIKDEAKNLREKINQVREDRAQKLASLKVIENQINTANISKDKIETKIFANHEKIGNLNIKIQESEHEKKVRLGLDDVDDISNRGIDVKIKQFEKLNEKLQEQLKKIKPIAFEAQKAIFELKSKIKVVHHMNSGNRALEVIKKLKNSGKIRGIYGTIADLGSVDKKYADAMEVAAGNRFNFVIVENQKVGEECINYLKKNNSGRASFIPLDEIRYNPYDKPLPNDPKIYGRAVDLIKFDQKYYHAFEYVFGRTIVVETISTARQLQISARRVTLSGDIVDGSNLMTGGQKNKIKGIGFKGTESDSANLSNLEIQYTQYKQEIDSIELSLKSNASEISRLYKLKISGTNKTKDLSESIAISKSDINTIKEAIKSYELDTEELLANIDNLIKEKHSIELNNDETEKKLNALIERETEIQIKLDSTEESSLKQNLKQSEKQLKKLNKEFMAIEIEYTKKMTSLNETISSSRKEAQNQLNIKSNAIIKTSDSIVNLTEELKTKENDANILEAKITKKSVVVAGLMEEKKKFLFEVSENKTKLGQLTNDLYPLRMKLNTNDIKSSELDMKILEWKTHVHPDIEVSDEMLSISQEKHSLEIERLNQQKTKLGAINLRAIEKYAEIEKRFEELEKKNEQVIQEREAILEFIEALENEKLKVFMNTYNAINKNFGYIFSRLSPSGEAGLEIENLEDPFDGGVQILARPGEKERCNVMALSGGERTLTIIALILGIQMHVPSPYYILDEIDAALDDVNAALVADMIKELSERSQFIIITHRDVTMARVDHLLGVSNIEGITSVINLSIKNVLRHLNEESQKIEKAV